MEIVKNDLVSFISRPFRIHLHHETPTFDPLLLFTQ